MIEDDLGEMEIIVIIFFWPMKISELLQHGMFVENLKKISKNNCELLTHSTYRISIQYSYIKIQ